MTNPSDSEQTRLLNAQIRAAMMTAAEPIALGWSMLRQVRRQQHIHLTEKELFIAGAGYIFDAIVRSMTEGNEPTEEDMELLSKIHKELCVFHEHFNRKFKP